MSDNNENCCVHDQDDGVKCCCDCHEEVDTRPKHWTDAVKYVAEAAAFAFMCYCIVKCHG